MSGTVKQISLADFIGFLKANLDFEYVLLLGSGASQGAGVLTAKECIREWKKDLYIRNNIGSNGEIPTPNESEIQNWIEEFYPNFPKNNTFPEYGYYADKAYLDNESRRKYFEKLFNGKQPNLGYKVIAFFAERGIFKILLTTNFDGFIVRSLSDFGVPYKEISLETDNSIHDPMSRQKTYVVALHGDYKYNALKNTDDELSRQSKEFEMAIHRQLYNKHLIVIGYSGRDVSLMHAIKSAYMDKGSGKLFWCSFDDFIDPEVEALLNQASDKRDVFQVVMGDFDRAMTKIGSWCFQGDPDYAAQIGSAAQFESINDENVNSLVPEVIKNQASANNAVTIVQLPDISEYNKNHIDALLIGHILGAWTENESDLSVAGRACTDTNQWLSLMREIVNFERPLVKITNGKFWSVLFREQLWEIFSTRIYDYHLDFFANAFNEVFSEIDPKFELEPSKHYMAQIYDKKLRYSEELRQGLAESLVWLGIHGDRLTNCSPDKRKYTALLAIRAIFTNASWQLWGSLNQLLPTLAEAAPGEFLDAVEASLRKKPSPFDELFSREGDGITSGNYMTGLYWALEGLAWDEQYLSRVCVILAELAEHDPGGKWANRPANSIVSILLPWHPQTLAPIDKRVAAMRAIIKDSPQTAWKVLISLLPKVHQSTSGTHKLKWRNPLADDWKPKVTNKEYWDQVVQYAEMVVAMACNDLSKATALVGNIDNLPQPSFDVFLDFLASDQVVNLTEPERTPIWDNLTEFVNKHKRFSDADWALKSDLVGRLDAVAEKLSPKSAVYLFERLFGNRDFDLYEENGDFQAEQEKLANKRKSAIEEIFQAGGINAILNFSRRVENPRQVGYAFGCLGLAEVDDYLFPDFLLDAITIKDDFVHNYVLGRYQNEGWDWVDRMDKAQWTSDQKARFLSYLPFIKESWQRAFEWLGTDEGIYWKQANVNPYATDDDLIPAIDKLLEFGRPVAVIDCFYCMAHRKIPLDINRSIKALLQAATSPEEKNTYGFTHATDLIQALQESPDVPVGDMVQVEFLYLPLLSRHNNAEPKHLHKRLSESPEFFCEVISYVYRSKDDPKEGQEEDKSLKNIATNAWHLLYDWERTPGTQDDGSFSGDAFLDWFTKAKALCESVGRLDGAMIEVGKVLRYTPKDPDGLWIHKSVLDVLESRESEIIREFFRSEVFNSRGVHWVDPTGKPEQDLANEWLEKANAVEMLGYPRFASELKSLADSYARDAERIRKEHGKEE